MIRANIPLFEEFEEELGSEKMGNTDELRDMGKRFKGRLDVIAKLLDVLEKKGWTWTTGTRDIILYKNITKKNAEKEFAALKIPEGIIEID